MTSTEQIQQFEKWYRTAHPRLVMFVAASLGDPQLAREVADEAIARAYERWDQLCLMDSPEGWTYRVAINEARRRYRRRKLEQRFLGKSVPMSTDGPAGEIWQLVADLPERQRMAVAIRHLSHLTEAEVAEAMGITRGTVSATLRAAYRTLRVETESTEQAKAVS